MKIATFAKPQNVKGKLRKTAWATKRELLKTIKINL
jgi:preprotein translocase subunit SecE